jgi:hypothetical protein
MSLVAARVSRSGSLSNLPVPHVLQILFVASLKKESQPGTPALIQKGRCPIPAVHEPHMPYSPPSLHRGLTFTGPLHGLFFPSRLLTVPQTLQHSRPLQIHHTCDSEQGGAAELRSTSFFFMFMLLYRNRLTFVVILRHAALEK